MLKEKHRKDGNRNIPFTIKDKALHISMRALSFIENKSIERINNMNAKKTTTYFNVETNSYTQKERNLDFIDEKIQNKVKESNVIGIYPGFTYQKIDGYGCAMTETSCYLLSKMESEYRKRALKCWFGKGGVQATFVRIHIDSCDFALSEYQAVENPLSDPELKTFSIERDKKYIIPVMKEAMKICEKPISVLLSPWSPPVQWKTPPEITENDKAIYGNMGAEIDFSKPNRCFGGRLKPEYYASWAKYLVMYVKAYLKEGIPVTMLSVQNEANAATLWDSCIWSSEQEKRFLKEYLYPEMQKNGLAEKVGIYIWDHNKERAIEHIEEMMNDDIYDKVEGFAYHWYSGDHFSTLSMLHERYPDKILMHSESCALHIPGNPFSYEIPEEFWDQLPENMRIQLRKNPFELELEDAIAYAHDMIGDLNHGMNRWIDWNMIVDRKGGPRHVQGGFAAPLIAEDDGTFRKTISYIYIKQIANTIRPGAVRIGSSVFGNQVEITAVLNKDGSVGVVLLNQQGVDFVVTIRMCGYMCDVNLPKHTLTSLTITENRTEEIFGDKGNLKVDFN